MRAYAQIICSSLISTSPPTSRRPRVWKSGATGIAYETLTASTGRLPLLKPMSEVAGRMSVQGGAHYREKEQGGRGALLAGVPDVAPANVAILGGGISGVNPAQMRLACERT